MATPTDQQLIKRAVYDDNGNKIREGLVPTSVANTRPALLEFWAAEDARIAEEEALAAQAEAERLAAMEQSPATESMAIPALQQRVEELEAIATQHADLLGQLESAQPDEVLRAAAQLQLAAGAAQAVEATGLQIEQRIAATAAEATSRLDALDQQQAASIAQVADVVVGARQQVELSTAQAVADAKRQVASLITSTVARVESLRGPRGAVGAAGAATTVGAGVPQGPDAVMPLLGRGAVMGDIYIDGADDSRHAYRWDGKSSWEKGMPMTSIQVRDVKISSVDASTKVTSLQTISGSGGGGGGGGEHLLVNRIGLGAATAIGDTSNWAGISDIRSGIASVDLLAMDGGNQGKTYALELPFTWDSSGDQFTADGELGNLLGLYTVSLSVQRSAAVAPAVFTGAMPPGAQRLVTFLTVTPALGGGGDTTQFRLSGSISYNHVAQGAAVSVQQGGLQPLWIWS